MNKKPVKWTCECCYCGSRQAVDPPPGLHTCLSCGRDFRTFGVKPEHPVTLSAAARAHLAQKQKIA